jgi:murein DD-endopeptidase MepM/ murein hydrolase activator NlpD
MAAAAPQGSAPPSPTSSPPAVAARPKHLSVVVDGPLERALVLQAGREVGPALAQVVTRALVWWISVPGDLRRNDKLDVIYEERSGEEPQVDAVRLSSGKLGRTLEAYRFQAEGDPYPRYYQPDGQELERRLRASPLDTYEQITSLIKDGRHHKGVDFKTPVGSKVKATFSGTITKKNWKWRANGNCLELTEEAAPHRKALFLHLSELPKALAPGRHFARGEVLADSGNTGHSFAPHLHYQLMDASDRVLDPFESQESFRRTLPESQKEALAVQVGKWTSLLGPASTVASGR